MNQTTVKCDICGDAMKYSQGVDDTSKNLGVYSCYPCKHMVWESELYLNDANVEVHVLGATKEEMNATERC